MTPARPLAASVAALGIAGLFGVPEPATAAPAPCDGAERYAAVSGAELFRLNKLFLTPASDVRPTVGGGGEQPGGRPATQGSDRSGGPSDAGGDSAADGGSGTTPGGAEDRSSPARDDGRAGGNDPASSNGPAGSNGSTDRNGLAGGNDSAGRRASAERAGVAARSAGDDRPGARKVPSGDDSKIPTGTATQPGAAGDEAQPGATKSADAASPTAGQPAASTVGDVRVGEAKSALVAEAAPNSAAVARMVNGTGTPGLHEPLLQQAPPTNPEPTRRETPAARTGPLLLEAGTLSSHAQWRPGMACGATDGKVTRAAATLRAAQVMGAGDDVLVGVPERVESVSTTALKRNGDGARTVAAATMAVQRFELLNGAVRVKVIRPAALETRMSTRDGGAVRYVPAALEVSGDGIEAATLDTAGDTVEFTVGTRDRSRKESGVPIIGSPGTAPPLTLPSIPGLPQVSTPQPESAAVAGPGTHVRISLGDVRQGVLGRAIAARAGAIRIAISEAGGQEYDGRPATLLDLEMGVLESAAVAPEPTGGGVSGSVPGVGGGLPLTGPRVGLLALGGVALLALGGAAMTFGVRRRRFRA